MWDETAKKKFFYFLRIYLTFFVAIALALGLYFVGGAAWRDWQRARDITDLQAALKEYFLAFKEFPTFAGTLTGQDLVNQALRREGLLGQTAADSRTSDQKGYRYSSAGTDYRLEFCLETNFFAVGRKGCNNQILVAQ